jgi:hypothetical protein
MYSICRREARMCSAIKVIAVTALAGMMLSGCSEYFDRRDTISLASGEALAADSVTQMIDPWPVASGNRNIASNGQRAAAAAARYRTGRVIPPSSATTSKTYTSQPQQANGNSGDASAK